jgi:hypothetical protein
MNILIPQHYREPFYRVAKTCSFCAILLENSDDRFKGGGMSFPFIYILIAILALAVTAILVFWIRGKSRQNRLSPLAGLAFAFIIAGIMFGDNRFIGYGLMGFGIILAVVDIFLQRKKEKPSP